jgi:ankyrin repeat protein
MANFAVGTLILMSNDPCIIRNPDYRNRMGKTVKEVRTHADGSSTVEVKLEGVKKTIHAPLETFQDLQEVLQGAISAADLQMIRRCVTHGANINTTTNLGITAVSMASQCGDVDLVRFLLHRRPDCNALLPDIEGVTPLTVAAQRGFVNVIVAIRTFYLLEHEDVEFRFDVLSQCAWEVMSAAAQ